MKDFDIVREFAWLSAKDQQALQRYQLYIRRKNAPYSCFLKLDRLRLFLLQLPSPKQQHLSQIDAADIEVFITQAQQQGRAPATINAYLSAVFDFFCFLVEEESLTKNPVKPRLHFLSIPVRLPRPMPREDVPRLFAVIDHPRDRAMLLIGLCCGLRANEILHLKPEDIDFDRHTLRVNQGKASADCIVYLTPPVEAALVTWLKQRPTEGDYLFCPIVRRAGSDPHKPLHYRSLHERMRRYVHKAGLDPTRYSLHTLRHTFATELLNAGISLRSLQELLGHKSLREVLVYAQLYESTKREEYYRAMERVIASHALAQPGGGE